ILYPPVAIRVLENVAQRALSVDALQLQVVARANKRRVDLQATHEGPAPFFIRGTRGFKVREKVARKRRDGTSNGIKVKRVDLMPGTRDGSGPQSRADGEIPNDTGTPPPAVTVAPCARGSKSLGSIDAAAVGGDTTRNENTRTSVNKAANIRALADNLCHAA